MRSAARLLGAARTRWLLEQALTGTADIMRVTLSPDGRGGETASWSAVETATPCCIEQYARKPSETADADARRVESENEFIGHFLRTADVIPADRVVSDGVTYEITGVDTSSTLGPIVWAYLYRLQ